MSATKIKDIVLPALAKFWAKIEVQINELKDNITALQTKMQSFENTKSEIVGSGLGTALALTASTTWANIVSKIKGVITKLSGSTTIAADKMGWDSTNHLWCYIPVNAFYSTAHWLKLENANVAAKIGLTAAKIVTGNTILGIAGTNKGYDAGYSAGKSSSSTTMVKYTTGNLSIKSETSTYTVNLGWKPTLIIVSNSNARILYVYSSKANKNLYCWFDGSSKGNSATSGGITVTSTGFNLANINSLTGDLTYYAFA